MNEVFYRFYGDIFQLAIARINYNETETSYNEQGEPIEISVAKEVLLFSEEEKTSITVYLTSVSIEYTLTDLDQSQYTWMNNKEFIQDQIHAGYVEKAIELGEDGYNTWVAETNPNSPEQLAKKLTELQEDTFIMMGGSEYVKS